MSSESNGVAAFAAIATSASDDVYHQTGMSLRDYFAAAALTGAMTSAVGLTTLSPEELRRSFDEVARVLYVAADAMIAAREVKHD